ncbi:NAD-dependent epimerase/dehydratase family protein [Azospirillum lipoferum]|uniref:NAD-dependent epimerase/dehydratase family protein n=1 Tax=Azospirillum lipoferum TaxID=193 RepID=UPI001395EDB3|nr:NAD-dependent epimerase/dehydratase family protein [Azospirillum lipoferum]
MDETPFTVFGAGGFIGSHIVALLRRQGRTCRPIYRGSPPERGASLGHVIYCIGLTADFRSRPFDTMQAHVGMLTETMAHYRYTSFLYLSTTRLYMQMARAVEDDIIPIHPTNPDQLYNGSKLAGECLCLSLPDPAIRVARLANVYGTDFSSQNFLPSIIMDALRTRRVTLRTGLESAKDYIYIDDAAAALVDIAIAGQERLYNVGEGRNTSHKEICDLLVAETGCQVDVLPDAPDVVAPVLNTERLRCEFGFSPRTVAQALPEVVRRYQQEWLHDHD